MSFISSDSSRAIQMKMEDTYNTIEAVSTTMSTMATTTTPTTSSTSATMISTIHYPDQVRASTRGVVHSCFC